MKVPSVSDIFLGVTIASTVLLIGFNAVALFLLR
jgi:hypothetical protein